MMWGGLALVVVVAAAAWLIYREWVATSHDYNDIEHRRHGMEVLWKMHNDSVRNTNHEGSDHD